VNRNRIGASRRRPISDGQAGFTIAELLVSMVVLLLVLVGVLALFDMNNKVARTQMQVAGMQQSIRISQYNMIRNARMAARGGLPRGVLPNGSALGVRNNVGVEDGDDAVIAGDGSPPVVVGTDVLTIRGVIGGSVYQLNPAPGSDFALDNPASPTGGTITIRDPSPTTGVPQDLQPLKDLIADADGIPEALIMVSPASDTIFAVVEFDPGASSSPDDSTVVLGFKVTGGTHTDAYSQLNSSPGAYPTSLTTVAFVGVLEEYRYYIREQHAVSGDDSSELMPRLSRARLFPGTDVAYADDDLNLQSDIADGVTDLQVALGVDTDGDGSILDDGTAADEWLFNHEDDDPDEAGKWNDASNRPLYFVRINTLARTDRRELNYVSPAITAIEDSTYGESDPPSSEADRQQRMYRRTLLQTMVDLRNLS
jgi:hypothetical protein